VQRSLIRSARVAAYAGAVLILFCGVVFLLVPYSSWALNLATQATASYFRAAAFPKLMSARVPSCSISDVWHQAIPVDENLSKSAIAARIRVLQRDGDLAEMDTPNGRFWIPERDTPTLPEMIDEQQRDIYESGDRGVRAGDVVLDCGANVGVFTRHALERGARKVIAIDPAPGAIECLRRNFRAEIASGRVLVYPKGVWNKEEMLELTTNPALASTANSVAINRGARGTMVPLTTIDALAGELQLDRVDFIKMDIEGAEAQALEGGRITIGRYHPRMAIALEHRQHDLEGLTDTVHRLWPDLIIEDGPCTRIIDRIQPEVLFVH
jgi:FkbM family methyltransferase